MFFTETQAITEGLPRASYQARVYAWLMTCFGVEVVFDKTERNHRFLEESLEVVQSLGCTREEAHMLVDYVYDMDHVGEPKQEVGGALLTLTAICIANGFNVDDLGEIELARVWGKIEIIRAKQLAKPRNSPLPGPSQKGCHPSHDVRSSDASTFDFICNRCGATDQVPGSWGALALPCPDAKKPPAPPPEQTAGKNGDPDETKHYVLGPLEAALKKWLRSHNESPISNRMLAKAIREYFGV